ncbi:MAG: Flp pilus assembly protein CpaB [Coriobacteriia bacterium]|nr:Flp pilus assembly protein CpaB [Coriobacteriia bacterium]
MQDRKIWIISIVCGIVCAACVLLYLASVQGQVNEARAEALNRYGGDQVEVCVATRDLVPGETISAADVEMKLWVAALLPAEALRDASQAVGSVVSSSVLSGEVISAKRLGLADVALSIPESMTAVSVPAKNVQAVGGAVVPGLRVDVYSSGDTTTTRIGTNLLVLATSASGETSGKSEVSWITLAVDPAAVQEMVTAAQNATLYFTLPGADALDAQAAADGGAASNANTNGSGDVSATPGSVIAATPANTANTATNQ